MNYDMTTRLQVLENRVASLKDWKKRYEEDEAKWNKEKKELQQQAYIGQKLKEFLLEILGDSLLMDMDALPASTQREKLNLNHKELVVDITHEEKQVNMTTNTIIGKVLFCALTELPKEEFSELELTETMGEHGWNIGHSSLGPTLGGLVRDGYLLRIEGKKPYKYRLPEKVRLNVSPLG